MPIIPTEAPNGFRVKTPASQQVRPFKDRLDCIVRRVMEAMEETRVDLNKNTANNGLSSGELS